MSVPIPPPHTHTTLHQIPLVFFSLGPICAAHVQLGIRSSPGGMGNPPMTTPATLMKVTVSLLSSHQQHQKPHPLDYVFKGELFYFDSVNYGMPL